MINQLEAENTCKNDNIDNATAESGNARTKEDKSKSKGRLGQLEAENKKLRYEHSAYIQIKENIEAHSSALKAGDEKSLLYKIIQDQAKQISIQTYQIIALQRHIEKLTTHVSLLTSLPKPSFPLESTNNSKRKLDIRKITLLLQEMKQPHKMMDLSPFDDVNNKQYDM
nr:unnamed protein product [Callosobruchus chinensis]